MINARVRINKQERGKTAMKRMIVMALSVVLALVVAAPMALAQVEQSAAISAPGGELAAAEWQWALEKPIPKNPLLGSYSGGPKCDGTPVSDTAGATWFLTGTLDGSTVTRTCTAPAGTNLFFPVLNVVTIKTEPHENEAQLSAQASKFMNQVLRDPDLTTFATVDGQVVQFSRIVSPLFTFTVPKNGLLPPGEYEAVADGIWVSLPPLSPGVHTIHFGGTAPNVDADPSTDGVQPFTQDNTYILTVK
jgi:hypothetical protein